MNSLLGNAKLLLHRISFASAIFAFFSCLCVAVLGLQLLRVLEQRREAFAEGQRGTINLATALTRHAELSFRSVDTVLQSLAIFTGAKTLTNSDNRRLFEDLVRGWLARLPQLTSLSILDQDGHIRIDANKVEGRVDFLYQASIDNSDRSYFAEHRDQDDGAIHIGSPVLGRITHQWLIPVSLRYNDPDGHFAGVLAAYIDPEYFQSYYNQFDIGKGGSLVLFSLDLRILVRRPFVEANVGRDMWQPDVAEMVARSRSGTGELKKTADSVQRLVTYQRADNYPIVVVAAKSVDDILAPWWSRAITETTEASLLLAVVGLVGAFAGKLGNRHALAKRHLETATNAMPQGLILFDADRRLIIANRRFQEFYGYSSNLMHPGTALETLLDDFSKRDARPTDSTVEQEVEKITPKGVQTDFNSLDGRTIAITRAATPGGGWVAIHDDVTERRRDEKMLAVKAAEIEVANERFRAAIDNMPQGVCVFDDEQRIVIFNERFRQTYDYPKDLLKVGTTALCLMNDLKQRGIARDITVEELRDLPLGQKCNSLAEVNGRIISIQRLKTLDGGWVATHEDITDRELAGERLRQAQKMEAVGRLTGGVAHDFNNMLTVITGTIEILGQGVADRPALAAITRLIDSAATRGANLTRQLLAFSRKQPLVPRDVDVNILTVETTSLLRPTLGEQIEIELKLQPDAWHALVDPSQLSTALLNLAINARDAMPQGGKLIFETGNIVLDEANTVDDADVRPGDYLAITISDTGTGIPAEIREQIFEPFFTTKGVGKGTGLGLSMVYGFVKQSRGHIEIDSEIGHGTAIKVYLPRIDEREASQPIDGLLDSKGGRETILVVEDDDLVRESVLKQLQELGYTTVAAHDAAGALTLLEEGTTFDLMLTDVILPGGVNGRQLADEVMKFRPNAKVVFTSGYAENAIFQYDRLDPDVILLAKPYRMTDLAGKVREALDGGRGRGRTE